MSKDVCSVPGCKRPVEYASPKTYCMRHWYEWWFAGHDTSPEEKKRLIKNAMRRARYDDRKRGLKYDKKKRAWV